jgi:polar amino acid transport system substrate-binding protein
MWTQWRHCRRIACAVGAAALLPGALSACGGSSGSESKSSAQAKVTEIARSVPSAIRKRGALRVAVPDGSAPIASVNDAGRPEGMDVDIAKAIAQVMGLKVKITAGPFDSQIPGLQSGKFDIAMGEYYVTGERLASADFVAGWRDFSSFATRADNSWKPKTASQLCGKAVGVMKGSAEEASIQNFDKKSCAGKRMKIASFPDQASSLLSLNSGRIDAVVTGRGQLETTAEKSKSIKVSGEFGGGPTAVAVARTDGSAKMLQALKKSYERIMADGAYDSILKKWNSGYGAVKKATIYTKDSTPPDYS